MQTKTYTDWPLPTIPRQHRGHRDPGLHVSGIIKDICLRTDPQRFAPGAADAKEVADLDSEPRIWLGSAMDFYLSEILSQQRKGESAPKAVRPQAIERDGIWMSADLLVLSETTTRPGLVGDCPDDLLVEEFKLTWMSNGVPKRPGQIKPLTDAKFRHWLWQLKAYCWAYQTLRGRVRAFHVMGDYRFSDDTNHYVVHDLLFTYQELQQNWAMLRNHGIRYLGLKR